MILNFILYPLSLILLGPRLASKSFRAACKRLVARMELWFDIAVSLLTALQAPTTVFLLARRQWPGAG